MAHDRYGEDARRSADDDRARAQDRQGGRDPGNRNPDFDDRRDRAPGDDDYTRQLRDRYGHGEGGYDRAAYAQGGYGGSPEDRGVRISGSRADSSMAVAQNRPFSEPRGDRARGVTGLYQGGEDQPRHSGGRHQSGDEPWRSGEARGGGFRGHGPKGYRRTDERITEDLCERLSDDDDVDASQISVEVHGGVATLTGTVPDRRMKHRAEDLAEHCSGVTDIENRIRVVRQDDRQGRSATEDRGR